MTRLVDQDHHERQRQRFVDEAGRTPAPSRDRVRLRNALLTVSAVVVPFAGWVALGGARPGPRPLWFVIGTALVMWPTSLPSWNSLSPRAGNAGRSSASRSRQSSRFTWPMLWMRLMTSCPM